MSTEISIVLCFLTQRNEKNRYRNIIPRAKFLRSERTSEDRDRYYLEGERINEKKQDRRFLLRLYIYNDVSKIRRQY